MSGTYENKTVELESLIQRARHADEISDLNNAKKYYQQILDKYPEYWEGIFFTGLYVAEERKIKDLIPAASAFQECIKKTFSAIKKIKDTREQGEAIDIVISRSFKVVEMYMGNTMDIYQQFKSYPEAVEDTKSRFFASNEISRTIAKALSDSYPKSQRTVEFLMQYLQCLANIEKWLPAYTVAYDRGYYSTFIQEQNPDYKPPEAKKEGCYVATCVYGSYDCPEVWTLRRYRDNTLASTWYGRAFIRTYYAISPALVKWFGNTQWFKKLWKSKLDKMVSKLQSKGIEKTPYQDKKW